MLRYGLKSKLQIYILTFVCYVSVHSLRTAYSFSKHYLPQAIGVEKSQIGIVDSLLLLCLGCGHFMHAIYPVQKPVKTLWIGMIFCAISYALIPFCIDSHLNNLTALSVLMSINGFVQSYTWPNLLMVVHEKWDQKRNSVALGFWTTNTNFGNIVGYLICTQFVMALDYPWEIGMYIAALFSLIAGILIFLRVPELESTQKHRKGMSQQEKQRELELQKKAKEHIGLSAVFHEPNIILLTVAYSLVKSVIYGILLWLPMYFYDIGLQKYETAIPITYDLASIVGSVGLGYVFSKVKVKSRILSPAMAILVVLFFCLKYFHNLVGYFFIIAGVGVFLGGSFNTMSGLIVMQLSKVVPQEYQTVCLGFYSALTMSIANITTALTQLLIGFVVGKDEQQIFIIFMIYSAVAFVCFVCESRLEKKVLKEKIKQD